MNMDKELIENIEKLDNNARIILKHSLFVTLSVIKQQEKNILEIIKLLDKKENKK